MATAAMLLIIEGLQNIVAHLRGSTGEVSVDAVLLGTMGACLCIKAALYCLCAPLGGSSGHMRALALDHMNDVITNSVTIAVLVTISRVPVAWWLDPGAAVFLGLRIAVSWTRQAHEHAAQLTGHALAPADLAQVTYLALHHDARIQQVDTVRAFHIGAKVIAEVDIVLPATMPLPEAHDIGESLQRSIEALPFVERAYVHIDTESAHTSADEHLMPWV